jgi:ABC-type thiamin/hydroxymethylpyrimidine transport system permease subunit
MYKNIVLFLTLISSIANASNSVSSELSHVVGGLIMTALVALIVFKYFAKYKTKSIMIGFLASMIFVLVDQSIDYIKDGEFLNQLLDFVSHLAGSIITVLIGFRIIKK